MFTSGFQGSKLSSAQLLGVKVNKPPEEMYMIS